MTQTKNAHHFTVSPEEQDKRLDHFLSQHIPEYSRTALTNFIKKGHVRINNKAISKAGYTVMAGEAIELTIPQVHQFSLSVQRASTLDISIIAQTEDFLVVNKPAGIITHPTSPTKQEASVSGWAQALFPEIAKVGDPERPGIVHRLDTHTTGLLLIARTPAAYNALTQAFKDRTISKKYLAVVEGHPEPTGTITIPLIRHPTNRNTITTSLHGRPATTLYSVQEYLKDTAILELELITGRTHQIRVHCKAIKHPLVGDTVYGKKSLSIARQALHSHSVAFNYQGIDYSFVAPLPSDMVDLIAKLRTQKRI